MFGWDAWIRWIIKHDFIGEIYNKDTQAVEAAKAEKVTGIEFLLNYCDRKF